MYLRIMTLAIAFSLVLSGCSTTTPLVKRLKPSETGLGYAEWSGDGLLYALPKTGFDITFTVSKTNLGKPLCKADKITAEQREAMSIKLDEIKDEQRTIYAIHSTTLTNRAVPDPNKVFFSSFPKSSNFADSSLVVTMGADGTVNGLDASAASKVDKVITKVFEVAGKIGAAIVAFGAAKPSMNEAECTQMANNYISLKRELSRYRSLPTPYPKDTLDHYIKEIKSDQANIQALFIGKPTVQKGAISCFVAPDKFDTINILSVYPSKGFLTTDHAVCQMGEVFSIKASNQPTSSDKQSSIILKVEQEPSGDVMLAAYNAAKSKTPESAGFFYSVPVKAFVSLSGHAKATINREAYLLPQLGKVRSLPQVKGSNPSLVVSLHPETGALKSVKVSNNAPDIAGMVGAAGVSSSELLTAITAQRTKEQEAAEAAAAKLDPLAVLQREQALLESELAIATALEALKQLMATEAPNH